MWNVPDDFARPALIGRELGGFGNRHDDGERFASRGIAKGFAVAATADCMNENTRRELNECVDR